jgi:hypothetical protein
VTRAPRANGRLHGPSETIDLLARAGVETVADVLARAAVVRDLASRSNHVLEAGGRRFAVKREKRRGPSREARGLRAAAAAGVPVPRLAFEGRDRRLGAVVGTEHLGDARPLDDLLAAGALDERARRAALRSLARAAAALHGARLHHRDLYLNHAFADPAEASPAVVLIDLERVGRHFGLLGRRVVKDLAAIEASMPRAVPASDRARLLVHYLRARGLPVRALARPLARRVARKAARIRAHVPRTPVGEAARPAQAVRP